MPKITFISILMLVGLLSASSFAGSEFASDTAPDELQGQINPLSTQAQPVEQSDAARVGYGTQCITAYGDCPANATPYGASCVCGTNTFRVPGRIAEPIGYRPRSVLCQTRSGVCQIQWPGLFVGEECRCESHVEPRGAIIKM